MAIYKGIYLIVSWDGIKKRWNTDGKKVGLYKDGDNFVDCSGSSYTLARNIGKIDSPIKIGSYPCVKQVS
jgi:hypothetical protein